MRVDWCQTHNNPHRAGRLSKEECVVVPSVVIPLAEIEELLTTDFTSAGLFGSASGSVVGAGFRNRLAEWAR